MQKSKGERIEPCGTPWKTGRGSERVEFMRTNGERSDKVKGGAPICENL